MERDAIVDEVRSVREAFAKEHKYDVKAIVRALQREEVESGRPLVSLPAKRVGKPRPTRKAG